MTDKLCNWGVIAPGGIAAKFSQALNGVDGANCHSVASRNIDRANKFATRHGFTNVHQSYADLASDPEVDAIYIASPHNMHAEQSIMCLNAGKAVLCEKPLTVNRQEAETVLRSAADNNVFYMEAVWTRFLPIYSDIRNWISEGRIGKIQMIDASFGFSMNYHPEHRINNLELAGGALLDLGIYPITFADWVMDSSPATISSMAEIGSTGVDEKNAIQLQYTDGEIATLRSSSTTMLANDAWIYGDKGHIKVPLFWSAESAVLTEANGKETKLVRPHVINGYEGEIIEVHRCLANGLKESPKMSQDKSLRVMGIMDEVRRQINLVYPFD